MPAIGLAAVDRDSLSGDPVERCHVIGYPTFMERKTSDGRWYRETVDAYGYVPVLTGLASGLLSVQVSSVPARCLLNRPPSESRSGRECRAAQCSQVGCCWAL